MENNKQNLNADLINNIVSKLDLNSLLSPLQELNKKKEEKKEPEVEPINEDLELYDDPLYEEYFRYAEIRTSLVKIILNDNSNFNDYYLEMVKKEREFTKNKLRELAFKNVTDEKERVKALETYNIYLELL